ncbi:MAG: carboxypeptidase-like regulatory domain-containing protein [Bacteroidetes bacterium]|nr:carboxypeptidase-like regulatory domain-containing protein [Bacteroidota bacterium]
MNRKINLTITKPCSEQFENFQPTHAGGFSQSCQKEVIDFTQMSDREILRYFENRSQNTCGRFHQTQLKTYAEAVPAPVKPAFHWLGAGLISFSLLSFLPTKQSQAKAERPKTEIQIIQKKHPQPTGNTVASEGKHIVDGIVVDGDNNPMVGTSILLKGTNIGLFANEEGKFKFPKPLQAGDILIFSYVGFETKEYKIPKDAPDLINIKMEFAHCDMAIMGEVAVEQVYTSKTPFWQKVKGMFK